MMGLLGRNSIKTAISVFDDYYNETSDMNSLARSLTIQIQLLEQMVPFVKENEYSSGLIEHMYEYASVIPKKDAKIMASDSINVGLKVRKQFRNKSAYYAYLIMGAFYQSIVELSGINSRPINRKYTRAFLLQKQCIDRIIKVMEGV